MYQRMRISVCFYRQVIKALWGFGKEVELSVKLGAVGGLLKFEACRSPVSNHSRWAEVSFAAT